MRTVVLVITASCFVWGCVDGKGQQSAGETLVSCRGVYYTRDSAGTLKKFNEWYNVSAKACFTDPMALSQWEKTSEAWDKTRVECIPQPQFASRSLVSANNYYSYRDGRSYLDLDSSTGVYRRLVLGEDRLGKPTFARLQGCFYQRVGQGVDAGFGNQILLDTEITKIKSSEVFDPWEIFRYSETPTSMEMTRFDASGDWDYRFCPELLTPWGFCDLLRNGNIYYYPSLTALQASALLDEALLIRKQFNHITISKQDFEDTWENVEKTHGELGRNNWKYMVNGIVDTPPFVDQAWKDYVKGLRPYMPDVNSNQMPSLCYPGERDVVYGDGSTGKVYGEVCYENGEYVFRGF